MVTLSEKHACLDTEQNISLKELMAQCVEHGRTPYIIRLPDYRVFQVYVAEDALGEECLQKVGYGYI